MTIRFWRNPWLLGLALTLFLVANDQGDLIQGLERTAYDWGVQLSARPPKHPISILAIDEKSISELGRWPWPRDTHARLINKLAQGKPKVVVENVLFLEAQNDPGLAHLTRALGFLQSSSLHQMSPKKGDEEADNQMAMVRDSRVLSRILTDAIQKLDTDRQLANALREAGNVVLGGTFIPGLPTQAPTKPLDDYLHRHTIPPPAEPIPEVAQPLMARAATPPMAQLGRAAAGVGAQVLALDSDGSLRSLPLVVSFQGDFFPSLTLLTAARALNLSASDIHLHPDGTIQLGNLQLPTNHQRRFNPYFYSDPRNDHPFPVDSFVDLLNGRIKAGKYRDRIVLIGVTAPGLAGHFATPLSPAMAPVTLLAHGVESLLNLDRFTIPSWGFPAKLGLYLALLLFLAGVLPRLSPGGAAIISLLIGLGLVGTHFYLMVATSLWLQLMGPLLLLAIGYPLFTTRGFLASERNHRTFAAESAENNRLLGLVFQGQGQLDLAFEKFRKCPPDETLMEIYFHLALDFERKRQYAKASSAYRTILDHAPGFRDVAERLERTDALSSNLMPGPASTGANTLLPTPDTEGVSDVQKPMLGRYIIEKELGRGAMGVVYQGRDPKINRTVAIKTLPLGDEFAGEDLQNAKTRFFREAESAGRLNHPNIVTIHDSGEEQDVAYIAMAFLPGHNLERYTQEGDLLPLTRLIQIMAKVAMALDYAHKNGVVHRDIKPANVLYDPESGDVKVTDFGIARLTESNIGQTRTGHVMGTPHYMSPEQIAGAKVDGRSDLFSLGTLFYQLLTGRRPFHGDDLASTLFQITRQPAPGVRTHRPGLPPCLEQVINRLLEKEPEDRYQKGSLMTRDLVACVKSVVKKKPKKPPA
ncbi:MAG: CHASE2 domain-containing protein [Magnetococcales bacterium]|nr:CHASE2 domain-containing protein [Magnetococcales bacterium]